MSAYASYIPCVYLLGAQLFGLYSTCTHNEFVKPCVLFFFLVNLTEKMYNIEYPLRNVSCVCVCEYGSTTFIGGYCGEQRTEEETYRWYFDIFPSHIYISLNTLAHSKHSDGMWNVRISHVTRVSMERSIS